MVSDQAAMNLGKLMLALAEKNCLVKLGVSETLLSKQVVVISVSAPYKPGEAIKQLSEAISQDVLEQIADPLVIADAIHQKLMKK